MTIKCIIVDDEPIARRGILEHVRQIDFLEPIASCRNSIEASRILATEQVDLMFLDIQMPKLNGIDFLKSIARPPLVIFTTAYPEYALDGFELDVTDYLLKPISFARFYKAVIKAKEYLSLVHKPIENINDDFFFIKCNQKLEKIFYSSVLYFEGMSNYIIIHTDQKKYVTYLTFKKVEESLPPQLFLRIHKSFLVSIGAISTIDQNDLYINDICLPISKSYKDEVMKRINRNLFRR